MRRLAATVLLLFSSWNTATSSSTQGCPGCNLDLGGSKALSMLNSIRTRRQGITTSGQSTSLLESGIFAQAMETTFAVYPFTRNAYGSYLGEVLDLVSLTIEDSAGKYDNLLDRFSVGTALFDNGRPLYPEPCGDVSNQTKAYVHIAESLWSQPKNELGGYWYYVYPEWSYLDGMVSLLPFLALAGGSTNKPSVEDIQFQMKLLLEHCKHESGLLVHGYDFSRKAVWANQETGGSPFVWSRSLGWFLLGTVHTYERLRCHAARPEPRFHDVCRDLRNTTVSLVTNLVRFADEKTGVWYQLTTLGGQAGNYLESSGTALFITAMLRTTRLGMLRDDGKTWNLVQDAAKKAYAYVVDNFVTDTGNGTIGYDKTVSVCSLNSTATYEYYTTQPILENSLLGESAFVLASLEMERK